MRNLPRETLHGTSEHILCDQALSSNTLIKLNFTANKNVQHSSLQVIVIIWQTLQMSDTIWNKETRKNDWRANKITLKERCAECIVPSTHCSDRILLPSGLLPLYFPMQIPACRTVLQTVPPQSSISSTRLCVGGWECWDTNMAGWPWNRSCWCSPADRCLWRRQIWEEKLTVKRWTDAPVKGEIRWGQDSVTLELLLMTKKKRKQQQTNPSKFAKSKFS